MRLPDFIDANIEAAVAEWVSYARTLMPAARSMDYLALRNDAVQLLQEIAADIRRKQNEGARLAKSQGQGVRNPTLGEAPFRAHAAQRARSGFEIKQFVSEYRALRASVLRLWKASVRAVDENDLEDIARFNEALDEALAESLAFFVEEMDRARHLFLGVLSHDLRTPLSTIVNCAHIQSRKDPQSADNAALILRSTKHMQSLLDDLLAYIQKHLGTNIVIAPAPIQFDQLVRDAVYELDAVSNGRSINVIANGDLEVRGDARRLNQLLSNLLVNALKCGVAQRPITVTLDGTREDVEITVHNFGTPIPKDLLPGLFEPFVHGGPGAAIEKLMSDSEGLGLYITREIVAAHGGTISVTSLEQHGTAFKVRLPRSGP